LDVLLRSTGHGPSSVLFFSFLLSV
jgi:hypothetical protein